MVGIMWLAWLSATGCGGAAPPAEEAPPREASPHPGWDELRDDDLDEEAWQDAGRAEEAGVPPQPIDPNLTPEDEDEAWDEAYGVVDTAGG